MRLALEENAVAAALRLGPTLGEAHLARALLLYHGMRDYAGTRRELTMARAALPNDAVVFSQTSYLARREGRWQDALPAQERALTLDPRNPTILNDQTVIYDMLRLYPEEIRTADAAVAAAPDSADYFRLIRAAALLSAGRTAAAREQLARLPDGYDPNGATTATRVSAALYDGRPDEAAGLLAEFQGREYPGVNGLMTPRAWLVALVARASGDATRARAALLETRTVAAANVLRRPEDPAALALLGEIDAGLGRKDDARREGRRAVAMRPVSTDAMDGPGLVAALALIDAWTGETAEAQTTLDDLAKTPGGPDYGQLRFDPAWAAVRDTPAFQAMLVALTPHLAP